MLRRARHFAFAALALLTQCGDPAYAQVVNPGAVPFQTVSWTPTLSAVLGTGVTATGICRRVVGIPVFHCTVNITGTAITITGAGTSYLTTPFDGTGGLPTLTQISSAAVSTSTLALIGDGMLQTNARVLLPALAVGVPQIVVSFPAFTSN